MQWKGCTAHVDKHIAGLGSMKLTVSRKWTYLNKQLREWSCRSCRQPLQPCTVWLAVQICLALRGPALLKKPTVTPVARRLPTERHIVASEVLFCLDA